MRNQEEKNQIKGEKSGAETKGDCVGVVRRDIGAGADYDRVNMIDREDVERVPAWTRRKNAIKSEQGIKARRSNVLARLKTGENSRTHSAKERARVGGKKGTGQRG